MKMTADTSTSVSRMKKMSTTTLISKLTSINTGGGSIGSSIESRTTAEWDFDRYYIPKKNTIVVYSDYCDGSPAIKIADGLTYVIDLPFVEFGAYDELIDHINNMDLHVSTDDRSNWNDKVSVSIDGETLLLL